MRAADAHARADELKAHALALYSEAREIRREGLAYKAVERRYEAKYREAYWFDMAHNDARRLAMQLERKEMLERGAA